MVMLEMHTCLCAPALVLGANSSEALLRHHCCGSQPCHALDIVPGGTWACFAETCMLGAA